MRVKLVPKSSGEKWRRPPSLKLNWSKPYNPGGGEDTGILRPGGGTNEKEWEEALRIIETYDKMVTKWIQLLDQGRKLAAKRYEIRLLTVRQLAMRAMAKADRA